jgi:ABC-type polysaccharide/polyol phosphate transport system ATPase subunit
MSSDYILELNDVSKTYFAEYESGRVDSFRKIFGLSGNQNDSKKTVAIENFNLKLRNKDHLLILGYRQSGKSTLVKLISQLCFPDSGEVIVRGDVFWFAGKRFLQRPLVSLESYIYSVLSFVPLQGKKTKDVFSAVVDQADCKNSLKILTTNIEPLLIQKVTELAQLQTTAELLIFDDFVPTADDVKLQSLIKDKTVIQLTNNDKQALSRDWNTMVLDLGRTVKTGTLTSVLLRYYEIKNWRISNAVDSNNEFNDRFDDSNDDEGFDDGYEIRISGADYSKIAQGSNEHRFINEDTLPESNFTDEKKSYLRDGSPLAEVISYQLKSNGVPSKGLFTYENAEIQVIARNHLVDKSASWQLKVTINDEKGINRITTLSVNPMNSDPMNDKLIQFNFLISELPLAEGCFSLTFALFVNDKKVDKIKFYQNLFVQEGKPFPNCLNNKRNTGYVNFKYNSSSQSVSETNNDEFAINISREEMPCKL